MRASAITRRQFVRGSAAAAAAAGAVPWLLPGGQAAAQPAGASPQAPQVPAAGRVALTTGDNRADNTFRALSFFAKEIAAAIGDRRVVIKPNMVSIDKQLAATHPDSLEGMLEFLKSIGKLEGAAIAESAAPGSAKVGFDNFRYGPVAGKFGAKLLDLDQEGHEIVHVFDEKDFRPHPVRMSKLLLDPKTFILSAAKLKTHDWVVATLSLKNIVFGAPIKDAGFAFRGGKAGTRTDKPIVHGGGFRGINYNLFAVAQRLAPHLAVIDGFDGMEGNGPVAGTAVDHRICVAALDWLAADRVAVELMGIDIAKVGYLNYCTAAGTMGQGDLKKIEVLGEPIAKHVKTYKLADNVEKQLIWRKPA